MNMLQKRATLQNRFGSRDSQRRRSAHSPMRFIDWQKSIHPLRLSASGDDWNTPSSSLFSTMG